MKAVAHQVEVQKPTRHKVTLKRKQLLNELLVNSRGVTYRTAVELYWYLRSFHNPIKARKQNGNVVSITKLHTDGLHLTRAELAKALGCSKRAISANLAVLERFGLIARDYTKKGLSVNHLVIYVLKNTPHFYNEYGVSENRISELKPHTNSPYIEENFGVKFNPQNLGVNTASKSIGYCSRRNTNNSEEELLLLHNNNYSSCYNNSQNKKNNIYLVENSTSKTPPKKSSLDEDFTANTEQEEIDIKSYCYDTAIDDMPEYATADFGLAMGLFDYSGHQPDATPATKASLPQPTASEIPEPQPTPIASVEDRTNQMVSIQDLMQLIPEPIMETKEEEKPMALPEKKQDLRQHLNYEIHRTFPKNTSESLQESLIITPIAPNKIGLKFNKKLPLKTDEKEQLRQCVKVVYGENILMVAVGDKPKIQEVIKPSMPRVEDTENRSNTIQPEIQTRWTRTKDYLMKVYDKDLVNACLQKVNIIEHQDQVTFKGTAFYTEFLMQKLETGLKKASKETGLTFMFDGFCTISNERFVDEIKENGDE